MIKQFALSLLLIVTMLTGCSTGEKEVVVNKGSIEDIEEIIINYASTDVEFLPIETNELETYLTVYDDGSGAIIDKSSTQLIINLENDITRLLNLKKKPTLEVRIPLQFKGKIILDGSSGNVTGKELIQNEIEVRSSSGNVNLHYLEVNNDVIIKTTSGNVTISFAEEQPNLDLDISTNSGRQSINLTLDDYSQTKKGSQGISGNGDNKMQITTKSGNINLK